MFVANFTCQQFHLGKPLATKRTETRKHKKGYKATKCKSNTSADQKTSHYHSMDSTNLSQNSIFHVFGLSFEMGWWGGWGGELGGKTKSFNKRLFGISIAWYNQRDNRTNIFCKHRIAPYMQRMKSKSKKIP